MAGYVIYCDQGCGDCDGPSACYPTLGRLDIIDITNPADPQCVGGYDTSAAAWDVAVSGNYAYVANDYAGLQVIDVSNAANPHQVGHYDTSGSAYGVAVSGNYAFVADGWTGLHVIDVNQPANPQRVGGSAIAGHAQRVAVSGNFAYVAGDAGLQVIEVNPANPQRVGRYNTAGSAYGVAVAGSYAYVSEFVSSLDFELEVIDVRNPAEPQRVGGYDTSGIALGVAVSGNYAYVAASPRWTGSNYFSGGLEVIDISDPANPQRVGSSSGYALNVLVSPYYGYVAVSGNYAYLADYTGLQVIEVTNPVNPQRVGGLGFGRAARRVAVSGNYAYVAADEAGLQVIDVRDPANPQRVGGYGTSEWATGVAVSGNYAFVADWRAGLQVIDVSNPANPQRVGGYDTGGDNTGGYAQDVAVSGNYVYLAASYAGLHVIDVSNPANPQRVGRNTFFNAQAVTVASGKVFVAAGEQGLVILDLFQPPNSCPSTQDQTVVTPEDTPLAITLGAERDADSEPALYAASQLPAYGALTLAGNIATYSPAPNYFGPDSFKFTVTDGHADCAPREYVVNISVRCVNDPPAAEVSLALEECTLHFPDRAEPFIISLNGSDAPVVLNATATDLAPDCDELGENLAYSWMDENGDVLGNSLVLAALFRLGCHAVTLAVSDGTDQTAMPTSFCVITPGEAVEQCIALIDSVNIGTQNKRPLIATLKAAMASFARGNYSSATGQLRAFQNKVQAQIAPHHPEAARFFIGCIEDLLNATNCMAAADSSPE